MTATAYYIQPAMRLGRHTFFKQCSKINKIEFVISVINYHNLFVNNLGEKLQRSEAFATLNQTKRRLATLNQTRIKSHTKSRHQPVLTGFVSGWL